MILGLAMQTYGEAVQHEQELLMLASDIVREAFGAESAMLRSRPAHRNCSSTPRPCSSTTPPCARMAMRGWPLPR